MDDVPQHTCPQAFHALCAYRFDAIDHSLKRIDGRLDKIETVLIVGNGVPSIKSRVEKLEEKETARKEEGKESKKAKWTIAGLVIAACLAVIVPKVFALGKVLIALLP